MYSSDQDILAFMRKDKTIGIQHLFDRYYRPLVLFADEFLKDSSAAEDLVQDFFCNSGINFLSPYNKGFGRITRF